MLYVTVLGRECLFVLPSIGCCEEAPSYDNGSCRNPNSVRFYKGKKLFQKEPHLSMHLSSRLNLTLHSAPTKVSGPDHRITEGRLLILCYFYLKKDLSSRCSQNLAPCCDPNPLSLQWFLCFSRTPEKKRSLSMDFQSLTNQTKRVHIGGGLITWRGTLLVHLKTPWGNRFGPKRLANPSPKERFDQTWGPFPLVQQLTWLPFSHSEGKPILTILMWHQRVLSVCKAYL